MEINVLKRMGLYELQSLIYQLQGVNKAFWAYVDEKCTPNSDLRDLITTVSSLINAEETLLNQAEDAVNDFVDLIEKYKPEAAK